MPAVAEPLRVKGLREMQRAFKAADRTLSRDLRGQLREVAEPVRADAERLALATIPRVGLPWSRMRVGVTTTSVYVAPRQRGARGVANSRRRPKFAGLLMDRAMVPALEQGADEVVAGMERLLDKVGRSWERG